MPISIDPTMSREIIMDHYSNPLNKREPENKEEYQTIRMDSDSCIDDITIYLKIDGDKIVDACFYGVACTISTSSTDILCEMIKNKSFKEALYIIEQYKNMIYEKPFDESILEELLAFVNTHKQAARIKCATLGFNGCEEIINKDLKLEKDNGK